MAPAGAVVRIELLAVVGQHPLQLVAAAPGPIDEALLVAELRHHRLEQLRARTPEAVGQPAGLERVEAEDLERRPARPERRFERLALDVRDAHLAQLEPVADVAGAGHDRRGRERLACRARELDAVVDVVDRDDDQLRPVGAGRAQQVEPRRVAVEHLGAEAPQQLDLVGVVIEHDRLVAGAGEHPLDDLPVAAEAGDDHRRLLVDAVVVALPADDAGDQPVGDEQHDRRRGHRDRDGRRQQRDPLAVEDARRLRHREHHERELAPLPEQRAEREPLPLRHAERPGQRDQHRELDADESGDEQQQQARMAGDLAEVYRHADGDEEEAEQQALERLDVGLQRAPVLGTREQHAGDERAERHRQSGEAHQLGDAEDEQQCERGEDLALVGLRDDPQDRLDEIATRDDHRADGRDRDQRLLPDRRAAADVLAEPEQLRD